MLKMILNSEQCKGTLVAFMLAAFSWPVPPSHTGLQLGKPNGPVLGRRTNRCWRQHRFVQPANAWPEPASRYWQPVLASTGLPKEKSMPKKYICRPVSTYIGQLCSYQYEPVLAICRLACSDQYPPTCTGLLLSSLYQASINLQVYSILNLDVFVVIQMLLI